MAETALSCNLEMNTSADSAVMGRVDDEKSKGSAVAPTHDNNETDDDYDEELESSMRLPARLRRFPMTFPLCVGGLRLTPFVLIAGTAARQSKCGKTKPTATVRSTLITLVIWMRCVGQGSRTSLATPDVPFVCIFRVGPKRGGHAVALGFHPMGTMVGLGQTRSQEAFLLH